MSAYVRLLENAISKADYHAYLEQRAQAIGAEFGCTLEIDCYCVDGPGEGSVHIMDLSRRSGPAGSGAKALSKFLRLCDMENLWVTLSAMDSHPALIRYYMQFGFVASDAPADWDVEEWAKEYDEDEEGQESLHMSRAPK